MNDNIYNFEVDGSTKIGDLKALIEVEGSIQIEQQELLFNNKFLDNDEITIDGLKGTDQEIKDEDMILLQRKFVNPFMQSQPRANTQPASQSNAGNMSGADFANMFASAMGGGQPAPQQQQPASMDSIIQQAMGAMGGGSGGAGGDYQY